MLEREAQLAINLLPLLRQVERMARIGFWRLDVETGAVFASPQVYAIYGIEPKDRSTFDRALSYLPQPHRAVMEQAVARARTQGEAYDLEIDLVAADGTCKRVRQIGEPEYADGRIVAIIGVMQDITQQHRLETELRAAATTDALTGLPNRRHLEMFYQDRRLDQLNPAQMQGFALALIDLDHFKAINDARGHATGDAALKEVARRLMHPRYADCFVARLAGDEFVMVITEPAMMQGLSAVCEQLLADLAQPLARQDRPLELSATIGVAVSEWGGVSLSDMLECADAALYVAKNNGRGSAAISSREDLFMQDPAAMGTIPPVTPPPGAPSRGTAKRAA